MYAVEDATFRRARSILVALAKELTGQQEAGTKQPIDLHGLVRRSADVPLPEGEEAAHAWALAADLARLFSVEEMFPRKRRSAR